MAYWIRTSLRLTKAVTILRKFFLTVPRVKFRVHSTSIRNKLICSLKKHSAFVATGEAVRSPVYQLFITCDNLLKKSNITWSFKRFLSLLSKRIAGVKFMRDHSAARYQLLSTLIILWQLLQHLWRFEATAICKFCRYPLSRNSFQKDESLLLNLSRHGAVLIEHTPSVFMISPDAWAYSFFYNSIDITMLSQTNNKKQA